MSVCVHVCTTLSGVAPGGGALFLCSSHASISEACALGICSLLVNAETLSLQGLLRLLPQRYDYCVVYRLFNNYHCQPAIQELYNLVD